MSVTERTKDKPIHSTLFFSAKSKSNKSFLVRQGNDIFVLGRFTPFLEESVPPFTTVAFTVSLRLVAVTFNNNFPSSISTLSPIATSLGNCL